jgi:bifunctional non-homologous end joining protein LigD
MLAAGSLVTNELFQFMSSSKFPEWVTPMAATLTQERFTGPEWTFEKKFDGIRLISFKDANGVQLFSRNHLPQHLPSIAQAISSLPHSELILDGELTWHGGKTTYHIFDCVWIDGRDLTAHPLDERRKVLEQLGLKQPLELVTEIHHEAPWELARNEGWEGVVAKHRNSPYEQKRSPNWMKMKCEFSQELVVGGFTDPQGKRVGLGALLVGYYEKNDLVFAGRVGTGFDTKLLLELREQLDQIEIPKTPFTRAVGLPRLRAHWVEPKVVVQVAFIEWTGNGKLRHPRLLGVRSDKVAGDVVRE